MTAETIIQSLDCFVIACDKREAFAQGSAATKQSIPSLCGEIDCFASLAMTETYSGAPERERRQ
jgi:hypothetical protein